MTISETCAAFYGRIVSRKGRREFVENRCDVCPLRAPCLVRGGAPAASMEQLVESRVQWERAAMKILEAER